MKTNLIFIFLLLCTNYLSTKEIINTMNKKMQDKNILLSDSSWDADFIQVYTNENKEILFGEVLSFPDNIIFYKYDISENTLKEIDRPNIYGKFCFINNDYESSEYLELQKHFLFDEDIMDYIKIGENKYICNIDKAAYSSKQLVYLALLDGKKITKNFISLNGEKIHSYAGYDISSIYYDDISQNVYFIGSYVNIDIRGMMILKYNLIFGLILVDFYGHLF